MINPRNPLDYGGGAGGTIVGQQRPVVADGSELLPDPLNLRDPRSPGAPLIPRVEWDLSPWNRWTYQHISEMVPTAPIWRGPGPVRSLPESIQPLGQVMVDFQDGEQAVDEFLERSFTDGFLVLHRGRIVYERYLNDFVPHRQHVLMSATKSFTGTLAGILANKGLLDLKKPVTDYLPEFEATAYRGATVQHLLDMASGVVFDESHSESRNEDSDMQKGYYAGWYHERVAGWPRTYWELALSLDKTERPHGASYSYRSIETAVVGFILQRVTGMSMADLISREIWAPMGAEQDAYIVVDQGGLGIASGGMCVTMRDLGRFAQLLIEGGAREGRQIIPQGWIEEVLDGGGAPLEGPEWGGTVRAYHDFWRVDRDHRALWAIGYGGQLAYIEPDAELAVVKLSYWPSDEAHAQLYDDTRTAVLAIRSVLL